MNNPNIANRSPDSTVPRRQASAKHSLPSSKSPCRPRVLALLSLGLLACAACGKPAPPAVAGKVSPSASMPNIVLIVLDTTRADHLGFMGYPRETAPYLAALARNGAVFERAFSTSGWTAPATASIHTGLLPWQHGVHVGLAIYETVKSKEPDTGLRLKKLPAGCTTIAETLAPLGYTTLGVAANINISTELGFHRGFGHFQSFNDAPAEDVVEVVRSWLPKITASERYFLLLHLNDPHHPYVARDPWHSPPPEGASDLERWIAAYDSEIAHMDHQLSRMSEMLGWDANTLLIVTADHGEEFLDHGEIGHAHSLYRELVQVPLVFHAPGLGIKPARIQANVSLIDLVPTLRDLLDMSQDRRLRGISLWPVLQGTAELPDDRIVFGSLQRKFRRAKPPLDLQTAIQGEWHYISHNVEGDLLFSLAEDPAEKTNLAASNHPIAQSLKSKIAATVAELPEWTGETATINLDEAQLDSLRALGYVN